ncbi:hypothetical protein ACFLY7_02695 [Patescibacteria group bacterium]
MKKDVFSNYINEHKYILNGIGVIATITALFLNLDKDLFGESLSDLQLLLLLFLILGLVFLIINSIFWFIKNTDSFFSSIIIITQSLIVWNIWEFTIDNFRGELNKYLISIFIIVIFTIVSFVNKIKKPIESFINKSFSKPIINSLFHSLLTFLFLYFCNIFMGYYLSFVSEKKISLIRPSELSVFLAIWVFVVELYFSLFIKNIKERSNLYLSIFMVVMFILSLLIILLPFIIDTYLIITNKINL